VVQNIYFTHECLISLTWLIKHHLWYHNTDHNMKYHTYTLSAECILQVADRVSDWVGNMSARVEHNQWSDNIQVITDDMQLLTHWYAKQLIKMIIHGKKGKVVAELKGGADRQFFCPQPNTSCNCKTMDTGPVHHVECMCFRWYQIILLCSRGNRVWKTYLRVWHSSALAGSEKSSDQQSK